MPGPGHTASETRVSIKTSISKSSTYPTFPIIALYSVSNTEKNRVRLEWMLGHGNRKRVIEFRVIHSTE